MAHPARRHHRVWVGGGLAILVIGLMALGFWSRSLERLDRLRRQAEQAAEAGDREAAAVAWEAYNHALVRPDPLALMAEARAWLAVGSARQAGAVLRRAVEADPSSWDPWLLRLEILRVQDRPADALREGLDAVDTISDPAGRRAVLRATTLALLADVPDDLARATLNRWVSADPDDLDSRVALLRRIAGNERPADPGRPERIAELERRLAEHPEHAGVREALLMDLAAAGDVERGRALLETWPEASRDARYHRLRGRWALDFEDRPDEAVPAFERVLIELPHDWQVRYRLARALRALGRVDDAREQATTVSRLRERLDPARLGPRLDADLGRLDADPAARLDLANLCDDLNLTRLAAAWRNSLQDADRSPETTRPTLLPADLPTRPRLPASR